jgi:L-2-hydroxyglutarate oxidase
LLRRGEANGLSGIRWLETDRIKEFEPDVQGTAALFVPHTGIVDYKKVASAYARLVVERGGELRTGCRFRSLVAFEPTLIVSTGAGEEHTRLLINCAGLQSDRVARACGIEPDVQIVPFRGDYYHLAPNAAARANNLIYPVPNPDLPFLGVHLTRMVAGGVEAGPNAVLAFKREGYERLDFSIKDAWETLNYPGFYPMAKRFWKVGVDEMLRAFSAERYARSLNCRLPGITKADLMPGGSGVRAQAIDRSGNLLDDFRIMEKPHMLHVLNAPSPAATASLNIASTIARAALKRF